MAKAKPPLLSAAQMPEEQRAEMYADISEWNDAVTAAVHAVAHEMTLRKAFVGRYAGTAPEGSHTIALQFGKRLKIDIKITRTLDNAQYEALEIQARENPFIREALEECVSMKPALSSSSFRDLDADKKILLADMVTEKLASPSVKLEDAPSK